MGGGKGNLVGGEGNGMRNTGVITRSTISAAGTKIDGSITSGTSSAQQQTSTASPSSAISTRILSYWRSVHDYSAHAKHHRIPRPGPNATSGSRAQAAHEGRLA